MTEDSSEDKTFELKKNNSRPNKRKLEKSQEDMIFPKLRPNFFLGCQICDVGIHQKVKKLQETILAKNPVLHPALINISTLHITLAVTHLANENDIKTVKEKLDEWAKQNIKLFFEKPILLNFNKVKTFRDVVAYVDLDQCENYIKLVNLSQSLNEMLSVAGFSTDSKNFTPHLTILKLSKDFKLLKTKKSFKSDFESLKQCEDHFGKQEINNIQLLSMDEPKDEFGYYKCFHQIDITEVKSNMDHSECCSPILQIKDET